MVGCCLSLHRVLLLESMQAMVGTVKVFRYPPFWGEQQFYNKFKKINRALLPLTPLGRLAPPRHFAEMGRRSFIRQMTAPGPINIPNFFNHRKMPHSVASGLAGLFDVDWVQVIVLNNLAHDFSILKIAAICRYICGYVDHPHHSDHARNSGAHFQVG